MVMVATLAVEKIQSSPLQRFRENRTLQWLCAATVGAMAISAFHPAMIVDWWLENLLVFVLLIYLVASFRNFPLSNVSYALIFVFLCIHEWGAHHKYADVPLGEWMKVWLHTTRNHYDRVVHLAFGLFLGYPMYETYIRFSGVRGRWAYFFPIETSMAFGAVYECIEATVASIVSPDAGEAFVGMQGDMWDSQKDMAMGMAGGIIAMGATWLIRRLRQ
jgi:putative membrane protein